jgi:hypothetical protein
LQIKTEHLPHTQTHTQKTKQQSSIPLSINVTGCEILQTNISLHIEERNVPLTFKTLGITALFLLECKNWACHWKDMAWNSNLLKFDEMSDFNKININWGTKERSI